MDSATAGNAWFQWNAQFDWKKLRIGYLQDDFEKPWNQPTPPLADDATPEERRAYERRRTAEPATLAAREYDRKYDLAALDVLKRMGVNLIPERVMGPSLSSVQESVMAPVVGTKP